MPLCSSILITHEDLVFSSKSVCMCVLLPIESIQLVKGESISCITLLLEFNQATLLCEPLNLINVRTSSFLSLFEGQALAYLNC